MNAKNEILNLFDNGVTGIMDIVRRTYGYQPSDIIRILQAEKRVSTDVHLLTDEQLGAVLAQGCLKAQTNLRLGNSIWTCRDKPLQKEAYCVVCRAREEIDRRISKQNSDANLNQGESL